jgi:hypothetical protein
VRPPHGANPHLFLCRYSMPGSAQAQLPQGFLVQLSHAETRHDSRASWGAETRLIAHAGSTPAAPTGGGSTPPRPPGSQPPWTDHFLPPGKVPFPAARLFMDHRPAFRTSRTTVRPSAINRAAANRVRQ